KLAVNQLESKLLEHFLGRVRIGQHFAQIAANRSPVALEQLPPGSVRRVGRTLMCAVHKRPVGRDKVKSMVGAWWFHSPFSLSSCRNPGLNTTSSRSRAC